MFGMNFVPYVFGEDGRIIVTNEPVFFLSYDDSVDVYSWLTTKPNLKNYYSRFRDMFDTNELSDKPSVNPRFG